MSHALLKILPTPSVSISGYGLAVATLLCCIMHMCVSALLQMWRTKRTKASTLSIAISAVWCYRTHFFPPSALRFFPLHLQPLLSTSCLRQSSSVTGTNTAHQHSALLPPDRLNFPYSLYPAVPSSPLPPPPFPCSICPRLMPSLNISPATLPPFT